MSSSKRRLPFSDPLYIFGLMDGNSSNESDSDLYLDSDDEQPSSPKSPCSPATSSFQSYPHLSSTSSFQSSGTTVTRSPLPSVALLSPSPTLSNSCTSSFQSYPVLASTSSFQSYPVLASTSSSQKSPPPLPPPIPFHSSVQPSSCSSSTGT